MFSETKTNLLKDGNSLNYKTLLCNKKNGENWVVDVDMVIRQTSSAKVSLRLGSKSLSSPLMGRITFLCVFASKCILSRTVRIVNYILKYEPKESIRIIFEWTNCTFLFYFRRSNLLVFMQIVITSLITIYML
jgi:hypothetical protein